MTVIFIVKRHKATGKVVTCYRRYDKAIAWNKEHPESEWETLEYDIEREDED